MQVPRRSSSILPRATSPRAAAYGARAQPQEGVRSPVPGECSSKPTWAQSPMVAGSHSAIVGIRTQPQEGVRTQVPGGCSSNPTWAQSPMAVGSQSVLVGGRMQAECRPPPGLPPLGDLMDQEFHDHFEDLEDAFAEPPDDDGPPDPEPIQAE
eukprot:3979482-Pyramimonas_sp.AAC.1